jgi:hypothetical protein
MVERPLPDRLSVSANSPHFDKQANLDIEVMFNGVRQVKNVVEFCVSEGWIRRLRKTALGVMVRDANGVPIIETLFGKVEPYWRD